jgi:hypothetical protein
MGAGLRLAPAPRNEVNLSIVLMIGRFALDALNLQKIVNQCHVKKPPQVKNGAWSWWRRA